MTPESIRENLAACVMPAWEMLPDFGLYMDQLLTFTERYLAPMETPGLLTASMINNYVKAGLVDRPVGKKYTRESLAQLLMIGILKQTTPLDDLALLIHPQGIATEQLYQNFCAAQQRTAAAYSLAEGEVPLICALDAAISQRVCRMLLSEQRAGTENDPKDRKRK